ncbi:NXPE family member 1-like [Phyllobates terribilis]|uniref:NXPE family member 1-like n=1 Tax=Phyllobates terribilis TaxID=111132 RepID=UPI003CCA854C
MYFFFRSSSMSKLVEKQFLVIICMTFVCILVLSFMHHLQSFQLSATHWISQSQQFAFSTQCKNFTQTETNGINEKVNRFFDAINQEIPQVNFTDVNVVTSGTKSRATIINHKSTYCVRDTLIVQIEMFNFLGKKKTYGGDFLRARIFSPELGAGASGRVKDFNNGTYNVHFTLFWEGLVKISIILLLPSEAVSILWKVRNIDYGYITFVGTFLNNTKEVHTQCGFYLNSQEELCKYEDKKYGEVFNCVRPSHVPCEAFISLKSSNTPVSYLTQIQKNIFARSNIGIEIPKVIDSVEVLKCNRPAKNFTTKSKCETGVSSPFPSGYFYRNEWYTANCTLRTLPSINKCVAGKMIYLMGDSTLRQWIEYFPRLLTTLKFFDLHGSGAHKMHLALDLENNLYMKWKKHGHPFITISSYTQRDNTYIFNEIDQLSGGQYTVVIISLGLHFRAFPIHLYIRRLLNIRIAIENLFVRSPDTKIIIKSENTREINLDAERFSDFHGYVQYILMKNIFKGLNVQFIDAWDMTIAFGSYDRHPPEVVIRNQINLFLTFIC